MTHTDHCDTCARPWSAKFEWEDAGPEQYCLDHLLEPIQHPGTTGKTRLDCLPDCAKITHRPLPAERPEHLVHLGSTALLYVVLTGRVRQT
jgi:hypothetical protein